MAGGHDDTVASSMPTLSGEPAPVAEVIAGRYRLIRWLGGGGMGRVYEVLDTELGEHVALKVLKSGLSEEAIERFRREVRLTRRIQHKNVARMFDIGEHHGDKFLTMELVDGDPLTRELGEPLAWERLQKFATQICDGLAAAHAAGVIHRDLKPDNVLIERTTGRAVITDFGIARGGDDAGVTQVGAVVGTPRYMAPEQIAGQEVDHRADIFSLGVILFELATGQRPWGGDSLIAIAVAQQTQPPRELHPRGVPAAYLALVKQCLALDREHRPRTAAEIGAAIAAQQPSEAPSRPTPTPTTPPVRPTPTPDPTISDASEQTTIAVLPLTCAPGDEYLADGVLEDLVDALSTSSTLRVKPAGIMRAHVHDPLAVGKELQVDHVVAGSLRRTPAGLRLSARLIGVVDGFQIWAQRIDCTQEEVLAIADQLARGVTAALSTKVRSVARPVNPRAVDLYLRAKAAQRRFWIQHLKQAKDLLEQALGFAPTSPQILSAYAFAMVQIYIRTNEKLPETVAIVERALATGHGDAYLAAASLELNRGNLQVTGVMLGKALARAPMSAHVHELAGRLLSETDSASSGRHHLETAVGLDPGRAKVIESDLARLDGLLGNWVSADRRIESLLADPDPAIVRVGVVFQIRLAVWRNDVARIERAVQGLDAGLLEGSGEVLRFFQRWQATGSFDAAAWRAYVAQLTDRSRTHRFQSFTLQRLAELAVVIEQKDELYPTLQAAADMGLVDIVWMDNVKLLEPLRAEPEFVAIREQIADNANQFLSAFRANAGV